MRSFAYDPVSFLPSVKTDITECELAAILDLEIRKLGSKNSFDTIVAFGPNASRPHHQPPLRNLKRQDTILIDFGARCAGYCSDLTRCLIVGRPTGATGYRSTRWTRPPDRLHRAENRRSPC